MRTGTVELNGSPAGDHAPMGGVKSTGIGWESGPESFEAYVELKSIGLPHGFAVSWTPCRPMHLFLSGSVPSSRDRNRSRRHLKTEAPSTPHHLNIDKEQT